MITQTEQMSYRLSILNTQQQKLTYQTSTQEKLQEGSDDSMLYSRLILVDEKVRTYEGLKSQIQKKKNKLKLHRKSSQVITRPIRKRTFCGLL